MPRSRTHELTLALRRLGVKGRTHKTARVRIAGREVTGTRSIPDGLPWLHLVASSGGTDTQVVMSGAELVASVCGRVPVVATIRAQELTTVQMPGWAFAALVRIIQCSDPRITTEALSHYLTDRGPILSETDSKIVGGIVSALDDAGVSSC